MLAVFEIAHATGTAMQPAIKAPITKGIIIVESRDVISRIATILPLRALLIAYAVPSDMIILAVLMPPVTMRNACAVALRIIWTAITDA